MASMLRSILLFLTISYIVFAGAEDIQRGGRRGVVVNLLREMVNQTKADTLNLPANATSIRENITDTFSCENRTYGYYADVDNECQIFHVCLTQTANNRRNTTYRWSFICPNETVFNQEVLTCTYPRDSINCEDSPMFYHLNDDIGKVNETEVIKYGGQDGGQNGGQKNSINQRRKPIKKQNIIVQNLMKEVKKDKRITEGLNEELSPVIEETFVMKPEVEDMNEKYEMNYDDSRLLSERNLKRRGRQYRGSFRFKSDV